MHQRTHIVIKERAQRGDDHLDAPDIGTRSGPWQISNTDDWAMMR